MGFKDVLSKLTKMNNCPTNIKILIGNNYLKSKRYKLVNYIRKALEFQIFLQKYLNKKISTSLYL